MQNWRKQHLLVFIKELGHRFKKVKLVQVSYRRYQLQNSVNFEESTRYLTIKSKKGSFEMIQMWLFTSLR